jgi:hypothetical protein
MAATDLLFIDYSDIEHVNNHYSKNYVQDFTRVTNDSIMLIASYVALRLKLVRHAYFIVWHDNQNLVACAGIRTSTELNLHDSGYCSGPRPECRWP